MMASCLSKRTCFLAVVAATSLVILLVFSLQNTSLLLITPEAEDLRPYPVLRRVSKVRNPTIVAAGAAQRLQDLGQQSNGTLAAVPKQPGKVGGRTSPDKNTRTGRTPPVEYELIIAHYNENLNWLKPYANHTLVYHQGNAPGPPFRLRGWERLENVGREPHAYLHHIIANYEQLANVSIFMQADHKGRRCFRDPLQFISLARRGVPCKRLPGLYRRRGRIALRMKKPRNHGIHRANETFGQVYQNLYGSPLPPKGIKYCFNACFGATKEMIRKHPLSFYRKAMAYVSKYSNQEESHYLERLWYHFFA